MRIVVVEKYHTTISRLFCEPLHALTQPVTRYYQSRLGSKTELALFFFIKKEIKKEEMVSARNFRVGLAVCLLRKCNYTL